MGTKERRERERQETRDLILDAARELFVRDGVEAVTMRAIARRIEYTPTAIYHHFRDKEALLRELCRHDLLILARAFNRHAKLEDPVERLVRIGQAYLRFGLDHPAQYRFVFMTAHPQVDGAIDEDNPEEDAFTFLEQTVAACIAAGRFRPEHRDAEQLALICWGALHGIVSLTVNFRSQWPAWPEPYTAGCVAIDVMVRGMLRPK